MNMNKNYLFGIGIVLAMLLVFTAPVAAGNTAYFVPPHGNATTGNSTYMTLYVDIDTGVRLAGAQIQLQFNPAHANITECKKACSPVPSGSNQYCWEALDKNYGFTDNGYMWGGVSGPQQSKWDIEWEMWVWDTIYYFEGPATVPICKYKVEAVGTPGESPFDFGFEVYPTGCNLCLPCEFVDEMGIVLDVTFVNGTFTHEGFPETFTKSLAPGWNLISLPLTPSDNSTSVVLSGVSDVVYRYDATSKEFECPSTMDPGIGYFVHVTTASTWEYEGTPVSSTSPDLKSGLNMIGVPNCTMSVSDAMGSADYRYVARWNAVDQKFEVYNPSAPVAFHHFDTMEAGEGYFVSAKSDNSAFAISCPS
jgi:hypothetical protein